MRLIDLDKALEEAEEECRMSDDWKVSHEMMNVFKYQPTVEAIPIKWIKQQLEKEEYRTFLVDYIEWRSCLDWLLEAWEEENEIN